MPDPITPTELAELRRMHEAATPGPWRSHRYVRGDGDRGILIAAVAPGRQSHNSYFIQLADWNALACHRSKHVDPTGTIPDDLWDELDPLLLKEVNDLTGGAPGIVKWPRV